MHFGIFMEFESRQRRSQTESFREGFDLVEVADGCLGPGWCVARGNAR